jgi:hypothetical protein
LAGDGEDPRELRDDGAGHWGARLGHVGVGSHKALTKATIILDRDQAALELAVSWLVMFTSLGFGIARPALELNLRSSRWRERRRRRSDGQDDQLGG